MIFISRGKVIFLKKLLSIILVLGMLMSIFCITAGAEDTTELTSAQKSELKLRRADANGDGTYNTGDVQTLLKAAAGTIANKAEYDLNLDGATSIEDALAVLREVAGIKPILSNDEAIELFNAKVNNVKNRDTGLPGFEKTITATCSSMKITQTVEATGFAALVTGNMSCTDLEYDKYVDKMVGMMENSGGLSAEDQANVNAMKQSAKDYRKPQTDTEVAEAGDYVDHFLYFPRDARNTASEITATDISSISYTMKDGKITYTLRLPDKKYTSNTAYQANIYAKVMNVVEFDEDDGSKVNSVELKNGIVTITTDAATGAMKTADYSYGYYSDVSAPTQTQTDSALGSITIKLKTKTTASVSESVVF